MAESLIVPVRMGIARPTAPFTLASTSIDAVQGSEELFSVEPLPPRPSPDQSSRSVGLSAFFFSDNMNKMCKNVDLLKQIYHSVLYYSCLILCLMGRNEDRTMDHFLMIYLI